MQCLDDFMLNNPECMGCIFYRLCASNSGYVLRFSKNTPTLRTGNEQMENQQDSLRYNRRQNPFEIT